MSSSLHEAHAHLDNGGTDHKCRAVFVREEDYLFEIDCRTISHVSPWGPQCVCLRLYTASGREIFLAADVGSLVGVPDTKISQWAAKQKNSRIAFPVVVVESRDTQNKKTHLLHRTWAVTQDGIYPCVLAHRSGIKNLMWQHSLLQTFASLRAPSCPLSSILYTKRTLANPRT